MARTSTKRGRILDGDEIPAGVTGHPLRVLILGRLAEGRRSPVELADELEVSLGNVSYHVSQLLQRGVIEEMDTRRVRGAIEHFYEARVSVCDCCRGAGVVAVEEG